MQPACSRCFRNVALEGELLRYHQPRIGLVRSFAYSLRLEDSVDHVDNTVSGGEVCGGYGSDTIENDLAIDDSDIDRLTVHGGHGAPSYDTPPRNGDGDRVTPNVSAQTTATAAASFATAIRLLHVLRRLEGPATAALKRNAT